MSFNTDLGDNTITPGVWLTEPLSQVFLSLVLSLRFIEMLSFFVLIIPILSFSILSLTLYSKLSISSLLSLSWHIHPLILIPECSHLTSSIVPSPFSPCLSSSLVVNAEWCVCARVQMGWPRKVLLHYLPIPHVISRIQNGGWRWMAAMRGHIAHYTDCLCSLSLIPPCLSVNALIIITLWHIVAI